MSEPTIRAPKKNVPAPLQLSPGRGPAADASRTYTELRLPTQALLANAHSRRDPARSYTSPHVPLRGEVQAATSGGPLPSPALRANSRQAIDLKDDYFALPSASTQGSLRSPRAFFFAQPSPALVAKPVSSPPAPQAASPTIPAATSPQQADYSPVARPKLSVLQPATTLPAQPSSHVTLDSPLSSPDSPSPLLGHKDRGRAQSAAWAVSPLPSLSANSLARFDSRAVLNPIAETDSVEEAPSGPAAAPAKPWPFPSQKFGLIARKWPFELFIGNSLSIFVLSCGAIWTERAKYSLEAYVPLDGERPPGVGPDMPRPDKLGWLDTPSKAYAAGLFASTLGLLASSLILTALFRDGRLGWQRARQAGLVNWVPWPYIFGVSMFLDNGLFYYYRFKAEVMRDHTDVRDPWGTAVVGAFAVAIYVGIQPHSVSNSEMLRGLSVVRTRRLMADVARFLSGFLIVHYANLAADRDSPAELRTFLRSMGTVATATANVGPLTPLRRLPKAMLALPAVSENEPMPRGWDWLRRVLPINYWPIFLGSMSLLGRLLVGLGAIPGSDIWKPRDPPPGSPPGAPPPDMPPDSLLSAELGLSLLAAGLVLDLVATGLLCLGAHKVANHPSFSRAHRKSAQWEWKLLGLCKVASTGFLAAHRLLQEGHADGKDPPHPIAAVWTGAIGTGLQFWTLVNLFAYNQVLYGRPSLPYLEYILQVARACAEFSWHMWVVTRSRKTLNPISPAWVETLFFTGEFLFMAGWGVPTGVLWHAIFEQHSVNAQAPSLELVEQAPSASLPASGAPADAKFVEVEGAAWAAHAEPNVAPLAKTYAEGPAAAALPADGQTSQLANSRRSALPRPPLVMGRSSSLSDGQYSSRSLPKYTSGPVEGHAFASGFAPYHRSPPDWAPAEQGAASSSGRQSTGDAELWARGQVQSDGFKRRHSGPQHRLFAATRPREASAGQATSNQGLDQQPVQVQLAAFSFLGADADRKHGA